MLTCNNEKIRGFSDATTAATGSAPATEFRCINSESASHINWLRVFSIVSL